MAIPRLCLITDRTLLPPGRLLPVLAEILADVPPHTIFVQLREKDLNSCALYSLAHAMRTLTHRFHVPLVINDRLDIALAVHADGVHLPEAGLPADVVRTRLGPDFTIGCSVHRLEQVSQAVKAGVDYVVFGPVWDTPAKTKLGMQGQGRNRLTEATRLAQTVPVLAIGGITEGDRIHQAVAVGAYGVAVIRSAWTAPNPSVRVREMVEEISNAHSPHPRRN